MEAQREGQDIFFQDFIQEEIAEKDCGQVSQIQNFFQGATVFVTGATGFIGQTLIEKLLRSTEVKKIYALIRPKNAYDPRERLAKLLDGVLFTTVALQRGDIRKTVAAVTGDCCLPDLGLSTTDRDMLLREVDVVVHTAATAFGDKSFRTNVLVNIRGTGLLLKLTREMRRVKSFIYVSSSYSNFHLTKIEEKIYPAALDHEKMISLVEILDDEVLERLKPDLLSGWPDIKSFSSHVAEDMVRVLEGGLPVGVIRPSLVVSTAFEPLVGWVCNSKGPQRIAYSSISGIMRVFEGKEHQKADIVPVDLTVNAVLAFAWDVGKSRADGPNMEDLSKIEAVPKHDAMVPTLNYVSGRINPMTWGNFLHLCFLYGLAIPKLSDFSLPNVTFQSNKTSLHIYQWLLHYVPAIIFDVLLCVTGNTPKWIVTYKNLHKFSTKFSPYTTKFFKFHDAKVLDLWDKLGAKDKALFNFNLASVDWNEYMKMYIRGIRIYIGNEDMSTLHAARRRMSKLKVIYQGGIAILTAALIYFISRNFTYVIEHYSSKSKFIF